MLKAPVPLQIQGSSGLTWFYPLTRPTANDLRGIPRTAMSNYYNSIVNMLQKTTEAPKKNHIFLAI